MSEASRKEAGDQPTFMEDKTMAANIDLHTAKGWIIFEEDHEELDDHGCDNCGDYAQVIVDAGRGVYWAQCHDCAEESRSANIDAQRQAEYDCER